MEVAGMKFKSPINLEGSWGERNLAKRATSIMTIGLNKDCTGWIEWHVPTLDLYEEIGLVFEFDALGTRTLVDYDGVFSLPDEAVTLCELIGIDCREMRETLSK